ncbi:MAG: hypothetical protein WCG50_02985 [Rhodoferax sp.]|uniref:hypothetical protein n=1 Tax=Rhodoferax sp. TaxID=50421 RepID=UPI00301AA58C
MLKPLADIFVGLGKRTLTRQAFSFLVICLALPASAAPLDALLTALPEQIAPNGYLEVGADHMNEALDFFKIRDSNKLASGSSAGDYHGSHIEGAYKVADGAWLSGSFWKRDISGLADNDYHFNSWRAAGLYRFVEQDGKIPAIAVKVSAWGNYASEMGSTSPVHVPGATLVKNQNLSTVKITDPSDRQLQADLIGTWKLSPSTDISVLLSAGSTQLSYGELSATATLNSDGCSYQLRFIGNSILGTCDQPFKQFLDSSGSYGVDVNKELGWRGNFIQVGANAAWRSGPWTLRGGYLFYAVQREAVDDILASRGWTVYNQSQNLLLEANYRFHPHLTAYARSQLSSTMFFNEMPVTYNTFSSDLFGTRYSLFTVGLRADF